MACVSYKLPYLQGKLPCTFANTVKPPNKGHIGDGPVVLCREVVLFSEVFYWKFLKDEKITFKCIITIILLHFDGFFNSKMAKATLIS